MIEDMKERIWKALEPAIRRVPELLLVAGLVIGLQILHYEALHDLRKDFLDSQLLLQSRWSDAQAAMAATMRDLSQSQKDIATALQKHTEIQLRNDANVEALIRELSRKA